MGAVFDGKTKVGRALADPGTDDTLPNPGSLVFPAIMTPAALAGTIGAETKLVHGDRWEQVDGSLMEITNVNVTTTVMANETRSIMGNQTLTTTGNVEHTVVGNLNKNVIGPEIHFNVGPQNHTRLAPRTEIHAGTKQQDEPGFFYRVVSNIVENHILATTIVAARIVVLGTTNEVVVHRLQCVMNDSKLKALKCGAFLLENQAGSLRNTLSAVKNHVTGNANNIRLAECELGFRAQVPPLAMPGPGPE